MLDTFGCRESYFRFNKAICHPYTNTINVTGSYFLELRLEIKKKKRLKASNVESFEVDMTALTQQLGDDSGKHFFLKIPIYLSLHAWVSKDKGYDC